jgi:hypothetical protein
MKKGLVVCFKRLLPLMFAVSLSGCLELLALSVEMAAPFIRSAEEAAAEKAKGRQRARDFGKGGSIPFTNSAEDRLTRRTSSLTSGIPVDVSPYLLNVNSFALTEEGIKHFNSILEFNHVYLKKDGDNDFCVTVYEYDIAVTFEVNKQKQQIKKTVAACKKGRESAKDRIKKYMKEYVVVELDFNPKDIKNFKIDFLKTRSGKEKISFQFENIFVQDVEPCSFQFDAEVEYQKKPTAILGIKRTIKPDDIDVFSKTYRSNFTIPAAAAIDVQAVIWYESCNKGSKDTPLPIINFVKAVKVK